MSRLVSMRLFGVLIALILWSACAQAPKEEVAQAPPQDGPRDVPNYTIQDFLGTTNYFGSSFSPDKSKVLVSSDETGVYNAYAVPVDGGDPIALTSSTEESIRVRGYFPEDERFLYQADQGGNELDHVYVRELDGTTKDLTPGDELKAQFVGWANDEQSFFVSTNERDQRYFDIYEYDPATYERAMIFQDDTGYYLSDISADKRFLAFSKVETRNDSNIYIYDRESGQMEHLTPHEGEINFMAQTFSPDGKSLYFTTDEDSEFQYLVRHDLESGARETVKKADWGVQFAAFSQNGAYLVIGINADAQTRLEMYEGATMTPVALPSMDGVEIGSVGISRDETMMAFYGSSSRRPRDLYVQQIGGADEPKRLTDSLNPNIDAENLVDGEIVRFTSFDGVEIPGILYKPHAASADAKVPALVWVHGGPGGQSRVGYSGLVQYIVNNGYALYAINNRGSSGYGKTFEAMDNQAHGEGDLDDCVSSKQMLIDTGWVDPDKIGIIGGSYGGYMTLAGLAFRPEEFAVGVNIFGVSNWVRTLQSIPPWWEAARKSLEKEMGDFDDEEYLRSISPLFHADKITKPLLVLQGANDPRVLQVESDEIVEAVKKNGVPVEYIVFEDEGHGFRKKENQEEGYQKIVEFLDEYLKGDAPATPEVEPVG